MVMGGKWQYKCPFRKVWLDVGQKEDEFLKNTYPKCNNEEPEFEYDLGLTKFKADFGRMQRVNMASKHAMDIRLTGAELPFPPPKAKPVAKPKPPHPGKQIPGTKKKSDPDYRYNTAPDEEEPRDAWGFRKPHLEFQLEWEERDNFGIILFSQFLASGVAINSMNMKLLCMSAASGEPVPPDRTAVLYLLSDPGNYPINVRYDGNKYDVGTDRNPAEYESLEANDLMINWMRECVRQITPDDCKNPYQEHAFWRFQVYVDDFNFQEYTRDDARFASSRAPILAPQLGPAYALSFGVGPVLAEVMRGSRDILELLFS